MSHAFSLWIEPPVWLAVATRRVLVRQGLPNFPKQTTAKAVAEVVEF